MTPDPGDDFSEDNPGAEPASFDEAAVHELLTSVLDTEAQRRLWIKVITPILQLRSRDLDPSGRVQFAFDLMHLAACERVARILRSDLKDDLD